MQGVLVSRTRGCQSRQQRHMTPHASRATLLAAQLLCCQKITMLVSKLNLVHQCDSSSWAKTACCIASVLPAASPRDEYTYPGTLEAVDRHTTSSELAAGRASLIKVCTFALRLIANWQQSLRRRRGAGGCVRTPIIAEQPAGKKKTSRQWYIAILLEPGRQWLQKDTPSKRLAAT